MAGAKKTESYAANAAAFQNQRVRFVSAMAVAEPPALTQGELPFMAISSDRSAELVGGGMAQPDKPGQAEIMTLDWKVIDPHMDRGKNTAANRPPIRQQVTLEVARAERLITKDREDMLHFDTAAQIESELVATIGTAVPYSQQKDAWQQFFAGDTSAHGFAYDGQTFFSNSHPGQDGASNDVVFSNLQTGAYALNEANLGAAVDQVGAFRNEFGVPYGNTFLPAEARILQTSRNERASTGPVFWLIVGTSQYQAALKLQQMAQNDPTLFPGSFLPVKMLEIDNSAHPNAWYVVFPRDDMAEGVPQKPLIFGELPTRLEFVEDVRNDVIEWHLRKRWGFAYGAWFRAFKAVNQ